MALSKDRLGDGEQIILDLHSHLKEIIVPCLILLADLSAMGLCLWAISSKAPETSRFWLRWIVGIAALVVAVVFFVWPLIVWRSVSFTFTDRRIITQRGVVHRSGHDLPLARINDVTYEKSLLDRMLGCGTLVLQTAAEDPVVLKDIPQIERVHTTMTDLLFRQGDTGERHD
ncbi:MAG: PH domain-containing protein [Propionibacteriaceae bacterium]